MIEEKMYQQIKQLMPILCVDLVVHFGDRVLVCKRNNDPFKGEWWFPGGRVHKGETIEEAVYRKADEELGIRVDIERQVGILDGILKGGHTPVVVHLVIPSSIGFIIKLDSQHSEYKWVEVCSLGKENIHPLFQEEVRRIFSRENI